jgi:hypothetical protein
MIELLRIVQARRSLEKTKIETIHNRSLNQNPFCMFVILFFYSPRAFTCISWIMWQKRCYLKLFQLWFTVKDSHACINFQLSIQIIACYLKCFSFRFNVQCLQLILYNTKEVFKDLAVVTNCNNCSLVSLLVYT